MNSNKYQIIDLGFVAEEEEFQITLPQKRTKSNKSVRS